MKKENKKFIIFVVLILVVAYLTHHFHLAEKFTVESIKSFILGKGFWGPILFILLYIVTSIILFPAALLSVVAGAIWGVGLGTPLNMTQISMTVVAAILLFVVTLILKRKYH